MKKITENITFENQVNFISELLKDARDLNGETFT